MQPDPNYVLAHGSFPLNGGVYWDGYNAIKHLDKYLPIDVAIAGCMPRPEAVMDGIQKMMELIETGKADGWKRYKENYEYYKKNQDELFGEGWREKTARRWIPWLMDKKKEVREE